MSNLWGGPGRAGGGRGVVGEGPRPWEARTCRVQGTPSFPCNPTNQSEKSNPRYWKSKMERTQGDALEGGLGSLPEPHTLNSGTEKLTENSQLQA